MRKLPERYENPIDNILINICEYISPFHKQINMTPNILTTISLILGIMSAIFIYYDYYKTAAILYFLSYFYDCMDGFYARKYNMTTQFGDYYDHASDFFKNIILAAVIYYKSPTKFKTILLILTIPFILQTIHIGCQEIYSPFEDESKSLAIFKKICPSKNSDILLFTRFFGTGTANMIIVYLLYTFESI